ncbi:general secretion pathway protein GspB [Massilia consociata]|uniref:General secretion pathway protein GspB n=1 Tax=Massilia consociata TaxID=760117 RepID=A0ABV6FB27_9BURK
MSYILEALKKAQAERQLGSAPTIHAPMPSYAPPAAPSSRKPLLAGLGAGAAVVALGAVFLMRQPAPPPAVPGPAQQVASAAVPGASTPATPVPEAPAAPVVASAPEMAAPAVSAPAAPAAVAGPVRTEPASLAKAPAPVKPKEAPVAEPPRRADAVAAASARPRAPASAPAPAPAPEASRPGPAPVAAQVVAVPDAPPAAVAAAPVQAADDNIGPLQSLPEAVQRELPRVSFGGYIYSPNPAERLLLVDKMLRREGEEVAPGLVLERLLPKAAIMNFRGYRYRVAY